MFEPKESAEEVTQQGAITAMRLVDDEGTIACTDVSASFVNGQPVSLAVTHVMQSEDEWDRFMRFMDRYADASELGFAGGGTSSKGGGEVARSQAV